MKLVCVESPLRGDYARNTDYARRCLRDSLDRSEAPFAGHLLYTQVLSDAHVEQREQGISAHIAVMARCDLVAVYIDYGITEGMTRAIDRARSSGIHAEHRSIGQNKSGAA